MWGHRTFENFEISHVDLPPLKTWRPQIGHFSVLHPSHCFGQIRDGIHHGPQPQPLPQNRKTQDSKINDKMQHQLNYHDRSVFLLDNLSQSVHTQKSVTEQANFQENVCPPSSLAAPVVISPLLAVIACGIGHFHMARANNKHITARLCLEKTPSSATRGWALTTRC